MMYRRLALVLALASCAPYPQGAGRAPVSVSTQASYVHDFRSDLELSGTLRAAHTVTVGTSSAGRIVSMPVRVGDRVTKGSLLADIDAAAYQAALGEARGALDAAAANQIVAQAQVRAAQARYQLALATARRMSALYGTGDISRQQEDQTQADLKSSQAALAQAQAALAAARASQAQSQAAVSSAQVPLGNTSVISPFSGIVTATSVDTGAVVAAGSPIATIQTDRDLEVDLSVPEEAAASLTPGVSIPIRVDALGDTRVRGAVRAIIPSDAADLHSVIVKVAVKASSGMIPGMYVRAQIPARTRSAPAVPASALVTRGGQDGVFAIQSGYARFIPVETGVIRNGAVEVHGLPPRTVVAVSHLERLTDGARVDVRQP